MDIITRIWAGPWPLRMSILRHGVLGATALTATVTLVSCQSDLSSLATRDPFYASPSASAEQVGFETSITIARQKGLLEIQRACGDTRAADELRENLDIVCQVRPAGFYGRTAEAYRRWVEDHVRELPAPSESASSIGG